MYNKLEDYIFKLLSFILTVQLNNNNNKLLQSHLNIFISLKITLES
jgi:hypothetical protein